MFLTQPYDQAGFVQLTKPAALGLQEPLLGLLEPVLSENHFPGLLSASVNESLWLRLRQQ